MVYVSRSKQANRNSLRETDSEKRRFVLERASRHDARFQNETPIKSTIVEHATISEAVSNRH